MDAFIDIKDKDLRQVIMNFFEALNKALKKENNQILYFALLDKEYLDEEIPYNYPQYFIITKEKVNRTLVDEIMFDMQDTYGWPYGHYFVNSCSRKNIFNLKQLEDHLKVEDVYMDLDDIRKIIETDYSLLFINEDFKLDSLIQASFTKLEIEMNEVIKALDVHNMDNFIDKFKSYAHDKASKVVIDDDFCRLRGESATYETNTLKDIKRRIDNYINDYPLQEKKLVLYGRLNGCGKSQYMYHLMGYLKKNNYPFIFRESFYFHYKRYIEDKYIEYKYYDIIKKTDDDTKDTTDWILKVSKEIESVSGKKPVLFIDETDVNYEKLKEYFIITGDKDIREEAGNSEWKIYDILRCDNLDSDYINNLLIDEACELKLFDEVKNLKEILRLISLKSQLPLYSFKRCSPFHAKRLLSLAVLEGVKRLCKGEELYVTSADVEKWEKHYSNRFMPKTGVIDDFHCEYIIYNGEKIEYDPYTTFDVIKLINKNIM